MLLPLMSKTHSISWQSNVAVSSKQWIFKLKISEFYLKIDLYIIVRNWSWLFCFFRRILFIFRSKMLQATIVASAILLSFSKIQVNKALAVVFQEVTSYPLNSSWFCQKWTWSECYNYILYKKKTSYVLDCYYSMLALIS